MSRVALLAVIMLTLIGSGGARANWYAQIAAGGQSIGQCIEWPEPVDESIAALNKQFGPCVLKHGDGDLVSGFIVRCERGANQLIFRHKRDCLAVQQALATGQPVSLEGFAPINEGNPGGWVAALSGCLSSISVEQRLRAKTVQLGVNWCECAANGMGMSADEDLSRDKVDGVLSACNGAMGPSWEPLSRQAIDSVLSQMFPAKLSDRAANRPSVVRAGKRTGHEADGTLHPASRVNAVSGAADAIGSVARGMTYQQTMEALVGIAPVKKEPFQDYLWVTYKDPRVLAYPDANGECKLTFEKGKLLACQGCDPARFGCE